MASDAFRPYLPRRRQLTNIGSFPKDDDNPYTCDVCGQEKRGKKNQVVCSSPRCRQEHTRRINARTTARTAQKKIQARKSLTGEEKRAN